MTPRISTNALLSWNVAGKYQEAFPIADKLLQRCEELMGAEHPATAIVLGKLGRLHDKAGVGR